MPVPRPRSAMRKIREILRLALGEGLSRRATGAATGLPYTTVSDHLVRALKAGLGWPLPDGMDDAQLEARLFAKAEPPPSASRPLPDWPTVHRELRRKGMTLQLLHLEYKERQPDGYQYTQFCRHYRHWRGRLDLVMRQEHRAGEKLFVDFAGQTIPIVDATTGEVSQAQLFVAVLGASNYTYAEALPSQELPHWIAAHVHAFAFLGGCTRLIVPDNLKAGVTRAHRYEPILNASYAELAAHYGCAIIPARPYKPRDKAYATDCTSFVGSGMDWLRTSAGALLLSDQFPAHVGSGAAALAAPLLAPTQCGLRRDRTATPLTRLLERGRALEQALALLVVDAGGEVAGAGPGLHRTRVSAEQL
jgi:transposase